MTRPAWAPTCTCGETPTGFFCYPCHAWAGASHGEQSSWSRPRAAERKMPEPELIRPVDAPGTELLPAGSRPQVPSLNRCKNGRYARPARTEETLLPCGCPIAAAPRECVDAVATKTVTARRVGLDH